MRLTNKIREQIVKNWTEKKWVKKWDSAADKLTKELRLKVKCVSSEINVTPDVFSHLVENMVLVKESHVGVPRWSKWQEFSFCCGFPRPFNRPRGCEPYYTRFNVGGERVSPSEKQWKKIEDLKVEYIEQKANIESIIYSVTTDKKLFELLPECKKYMPKIEVKSGTQIVAVDQVKKARELLK